jgi:copper chaperone
LLFLLAYSILKRFKTQEKPVKPDGAIVLKVEGMSCNHCANTVRLALDSVSGIASARVDLKAGIAYLTPLDPSKAPRMDELLKALEANGFKGSDGDRTDS